LNSELVVAANPVTPFRVLLTQSNARLKELFEQGVPAHELVPARAGFMDELLQRVWLRFFEAGAPDVALVAVGGYGRGELHPGSDVDLDDPD
jgi:[protein-PII] uridylyltransferase